ncbi:hypothetical protein AMTR_s00121p00120770 [Amborella trichopoda]|uniref:Uncharacterized protein n=1 Tax=Amborella trichopoda TaxID=13333 RepID=W1NRT3_AMBTC|nr:hypothetical protein AMTR_s00121p00120770 [Amborella trichopoda]
MGYEPHGLKFLSGNPNDGIFFGDLLLDILANQVQQPGGEEDNTFLYIQEGHFAKDVWEGVEGAHIYVDEAFAQPDKWPLTIETQHLG